MFAMLRTRHDGAGHRRRRVGWRVGYWRVAFWTVLLPVRLVFGLLFVPFWIARTVLKMAFGVILLPIPLVGGLLVAVVAAIAALVAVVTPPCRCSWWRS